MLITFKKDCSIPGVNYYVVYSLFTLIHDASLPVVSMVILNSSTRRLVESVEFDKVSYSSALTCFHGCC